MSILSSDKQVYFDFQDGGGWVDVSSIIQDDLVITKRAYSDDFHHAVDVVNFTAIFDAAYYEDILDPSDDIIVRIEEETTDLADNEVQGRIVDEDLVLFLSFDEESIGTYTHDNSGQNNHGTIEGNPSSVTGRFGNALNIDGSADYVTVTDDASLQFGTGDFAVSLWVSFDDALPASSEYIFDKRPFATQQGFLSTRSTSGKIAFYTPDVAGSSWHIIYSDAGVSNDGWHHLVCMRDGGVMKMYIDGELQLDTEASSTSVSNSTYNVFIGSAVHLSGKVDGKIDEFRLYSTALTEEQILRLYQCRAVFTGYIPPTRSREYDGTQDIVKVELEALDFTDYLKHAIGDVVWSSADILDPDSTSTSLIHLILDEIGLDDSYIDQTKIVDIEIECVSPTDEEETAIDLLDVLLYEHGYSLNWDGSGMISLVQWIKADSSSPTYEFNEENISTVAVEQTADIEHEGVEVVWFEIGTKDDVLIYRESLPYDSYGQLEGYPIPAGNFFPIACNTIDPITGTNQVVHQEYTEAGISYWTNKAIAQGLDYNFKAFESDFSEILKTESHTLDALYDTGIILNPGSPTYGNKKATVRFENPTGGFLNLYAFNIFATVTYKTTARKYKTEIVADTKNVYSYSSRFLFNDTAAEKLTLALTKYVELGVDIYTFQSEVKRPVGELVTILTNDATNQVCQILERTLEQETGLYEYILRGYDTNYGSLASQTIYTYSQSESIPFVALENTLDAFASDGFLVPSEKLAVQREWEIIDGEYASVLSDATSAGVDPADAEYVAFVAAYDTLDSYLNDPGGLLEDLTTISVVVGATLRSNFAAYFSTKQDLLTYAQTIVSGDVADRPTYDEIVNGFDEADGTTVAETPIGGYVDVDRQTLTVIWLPQTVANGYTGTLTNFWKYEVQVSDDEVSWYSLEQDGTDWKDTLDAVTTVFTPFVVHRNIPNDIGGSTPEGQTLYYRIRVKTQVSGVLDDTSSWSASFSGTTNPLFSWDETIPPENGIITDLSGDSNAHVTVTFTVGDDTWGGTYSAAQSSGLSGHRIYRRINGTGADVRMVGDVKDETQTTFLDKTSEDGVTYDYGISAYDENGNFADIDWYGTWVLPEYTAVPDNVGSITATAFPRRIVIEWSGVGGPVGPYTYDLERDTGGGYASLETEIATRRYEDSLAEVEYSALSAYRYRVKARDKYDNLSASWTATVAAPTRDDSYGTWAPADIIAATIKVSASGRNINVYVDEQGKDTPTDYTDDLIEELGFRIQISNDGGSTWYKPNLSADGATGADRWYTGAVNDYLDIPGFVLNLNNLPLTNEASPPVSNETYTFRVKRITNDLSLSTSWYQFDATCTATGARDVVANDLTQANMDMSDWLKMSSGEGLVSYWPLNDVGVDVVGLEYKDASGNKYHQTASGLLTSVDGPAGPCVDLDGASDYLDAGEAVFAPGTDDFSISLWFKTGTSATGFFVDQRSIAYGSGGVGFTVGITIDGKLCAGCGDGTNYLSDVGTVADDVFNDDEWHHAVFVFDRSGDVYAYTDGVLLSGGRDVTAVGSISTEGTTVIGRRSYHSSTFFNGSLAYVRIYSRALSQGEARYLYSNPSGNIPGMLLADMIGAGLINAEHLNVLSRDYVNNVSESKHLGGWGLHDDYGRDRSGTSNISLVDGTYDSETVKAMQIQADDDWSVRSKTWQVDHDAIYRVSAVLERTAGSAVHVHFGLSAYTSAQVATEASSALQGSEDIERWIAASGSRALDVTQANVYFETAEEPTTPTIYVSYIVGANRSVDECPEVINCTHIAKLKPTTTHVALRILRWDAEVGGTYHVFFPTATRLGSGTIVAENISVANLAAINANLGTISDGGKLQDEIAPALNYWDLTNGLLRVGDAVKYLEWDGSDLDIAGTVSILAGSTGVANLSDAGALATGDDADDVPESATRKWAAESGATDGWTDANKDAIAQAQGFADYATMVAAYAALASTIISGGYIGTGLVETDSLLANAVTAEKMNAENFFFTKAVGSENRATPQSGDVRSYLGKDPDGSQGTTDPVEVAIKEYNGESWETRLLGGMRSGGHVADLLLSGFFQAGEAVLSSPGLQWTKSQTSISYYLANVVYGNGVFVTAGGQGIGYVGRIYRSTDGGETWSAVTSPFTNNTYVASVGYGDGYFVACAQAQIAYSSNDGASWTLASTTASLNLVGGFAYGNSRFVAGDASGNIAYSTDGGDNWTAATTTGSMTEVRGVAFGNDTFVVVGGNGEIAYSTDNGVNFTAATTPSFGSTDINAVAYGGGVFVAVGDTGKIAYSVDDGDSWTQVASSPFATDILNITYGAGIFVAVAVDGAIARSTDGGVTWGVKTLSSDSLVSQPYGDAADYSGIAYGDYRFVAVGRSGATAGFIIHSSWLEAGSGIVEQGENSNGEYLRFSNGIQITFSGSTVGQNAWTSRTLPAAYLDGGYFVAGAMTGGDKNDWAVRAQTATTLDVNYTSSTSQIIDLITIGRWK